MLSDRQLARLTTTRARSPEKIAEAAQERVKPNSAFDDDERDLIIAADHPARGALRAGAYPMAMANRRELLRRLCVALSRPGVTGVLGTPDILEDLLLLGALNDRSVYGSMNRGGLAGAKFELDDRFTSYDVPSIVRFGFDGGKMLLRIDYSDERTEQTLAACAKAVTELAEEKLVAMVEPFISRRTEEGQLWNDLSIEAASTAVTIASGLGATSAYTWLKIPVIGDGGDAMAQVLSSTTLPTLLLGGEVSTDQEATYERWRRALRNPTVRGLVVGRSLLYPADGDVAKAVDVAVGLL
ncbi:Cgl0159 family (beta/alpha)8-fold protein [Actinophytocola sp.]|uniref:Cgl0159 family (beta/alpha)8-fold protein n=1 Tax=Actinophytocola sp. TaxID=1872138 RepID=UPI002D42BA87|nr:deoxyribose-phosphate aldolase [Actinophytocola sp.]HYQ68344.1 deoxyribose-phosphate aldolase [Actinophytocola sp.]